MAFCDLAMHGSKAALYHAPGRPLPYGSGSKASRLYTTNNVRPVGRFVFFLWALAAAAVPRIFLAGEGGVESRAIILVEGYLLISTFSALEGLADFGEAINNGGAGRPSGSRPQGGWPGG